MATRTKRTLNESPSGVALILVMLAILVLTTLAAAIVYSARTEVLASYNYRVGTQAEFVAQAGVQKALNFFTSASYNPLPPTSATTYYAVSKYAANPVDFYFSDTTAVTCIHTDCGNGQVIKLDTTTGASHYPPSSATGSVDVVANWIDWMNNKQISDGVPSPRTGTGHYTVTATLLEYHTVNNAFFGVAASGCSDSAAAQGICRKAFEVWRVVSRGTWDSNVGGGAALPTVDMVATIAPLYVPYFGNALYGLCKVTISGTQSCTDSYNSAAGVYGGPTPQTNPPCVTTSTSGVTNGSATNSGVGANGGVTLNGSPTIGGNVTYANATGDSACDVGFQGNDSGVGGSVLPGPAVPTPPAPDMSAWGYTGTPPQTSSASAYDANMPSYTGSVNQAVANVYTKPLTPPIAPSACTTCDPVGFVAGQTGYLLKYTVKEATGSWPHPITYANCSCQKLAGTGASNDPYQLKAIDTTGSASSNTVNFIGPANGISDPSYVAANSVDTGTGGYINFSASPPPTPPSRANTDPPLAIMLKTPANTNSAFVLDVGNTVAIGGTATVNYSSSSPGVPSPDFLKLNVLGTASPTVNLTGQAAICAMISVPNGIARLAGSGGTGVLYGSILAKTVVDAGNYGVHYDLSMRTQSGTLYSSRVVSVTRPKL